MYDALDVTPYAGNGQVGLPLASHIWFQSEDSDEAYRWLSKTMMPQLLWLENRQGVVGVVNRASLGEIHFNILKFGRRFRVAFSAIEDSYVIYLPTCGELNAVVDGARFAVRSGCGLIASPDDPIELDFSEDAVGILIQISRQRMESHLRTLTAGSLDISLRFLPEFDLTLSGGLACAHLVNFLIEGLENGLWRGAEVVGEMERTLMSALLVAQPHSYTERLNAATPPAAGRPYYVQRAEKYMRDHLEQSLTLADLVNASGVSERTLQVGFQRCYGTPPLRRLKELRLERIHQLLLNAAPGSTRVSEVAARFGLYQFGRFAADYKEAFGVLPSETVRRQEQSEASAEAYASRSDKRL